MLTEKELDIVKNLGITKLLKLNEAQKEKISKLEAEIEKLRKQTNTITDQKDSVLSYHELLEMNEIYSHRIKIFEVELERFKKEKLASETVLNSQPLIKESKPYSKRNFLITSLDSLFIYLFSYMLVFLVYNLVTLYVARSFHIDCTFKYFGMLWLSPDSSQYWNFDSMITIFSSGPLACIGLSALFYLFSVSYKKAHYRLRLFFSWTILNGFSMFLGGFISGSITDDGFGYVPMWLRLDTSSIVFISLLIVIIMYVIGSMLTRKFLAASSSYSLLENRRNYISFQVLFPVVAASILLFDYLPKTGV